MPIGVGPVGSSASLASENATPGIQPRRVVDDQRVLADVGDVDDLEAAVGAPRDSALALDAEADRLAGDQPDLVGVLDVLVGQRRERAVVEHRAVLVDLDERGALVGRRGAQHLSEVALVAVDRPRDERRLGAERERDRVERLVGDAERRRLRDLAELGGRRRLALGQPVDLVVEQQDLDRDVPPQRVDQVVAADRERVAVAGHDPDREVLAGRGEAGRKRGGAAVDPVHPVGVHVVGEPAGAADPGDEHDPLGRDPELGHELLDRGEHRVVAAAGAPARLLVGLEVRLGQRLGLAAVAVSVRRDRHHCRSSIAASISPVNSGRPWTFVSDSTSTRNSRAQHLRELAGVHLRDQHPVVRRGARRRCWSGAGSGGAGARTRPCARSAGRA